MVKRVESKVVRSEPLGSGSCQRHKETECTAILREIIQCSDSADEGPSYDSIYKYLKKIPCGLVIDLLA